MTRRKSKRNEPTPDEPITAWPSGLPDDVGSIAPMGSDPAVDYDDLGSRFLSDAVEQGMSLHPQELDDYDEPAFDPALGTALLRSLGLVPSRKKRTSARAKLPEERRVKDLAAPPIPEDLEQYIVESGEIDLTEERIRDASLLDHEGEEFGEIESPFLRTDDTHTHAKRRGGHAPSVRPGRARR